MKTGQKKTFNIFKIILSRFKSGDEDWVKERKDICKTCPLNTKNIGKTTFLLTLSKLLSQALSFILNKKEEDIGQCSICTCELIWKTREETEECPLDPPKWKSVYKPNSGQIKNKNFRK